jgi:hypothetical protein
VAISENSKLFKSLYIWNYMGKKMEICNSSTKKLAEFVAGGIQRFTTASN